MFIPDSLVNKLERLLDDAWDVVKAHVNYCDGEEAEETADLAEDIKRALRYLREAKQKDKRE